MPGQADRADPILAHAAEVATRTGAKPAAATALAERAVVAMERGEWGKAETLVERARADVRAGSWTTT